MTANKYWETEEFEDLVARSIIGLYEAKHIQQEKVYNGFNYLNAKIDRD